MILLNQSNFDLHFDIKNTVDLANTIAQWQDPAHLMGLMYREIELLNEKLALAKKGLYELGNPMHFSNPGDPDARMKHANHVVSEVEAP